MVEILLKLLRGQWIEVWILGRNTLKILLLNTKHNASHKVKSKYSLRLNLSCSLSENVPDWSTEVGGLNQVKE
jgi:hypothetical protein